MSSAAVASNTTSSTSKPRCRPPANISVASAPGTQLPSVVLFVALVVLLNLCPFHSDLAAPSRNEAAELAASSLQAKQTPASEPLTPGQLARNLDQCVQFVRLMLTNPMRLHDRRMSAGTRSMLADAKVLSKMAKVWYIKKKIKKLSKKLKKHTIAVPVFTAIPIYEHSYYPSPHVTHVSHHGPMHHAAAASSLVPVIASAPLGAGATSTHQSEHQQSGSALATSASNNHHQIAAYRIHPPPSHYGRARHQQIINAYAPSPPMFVDDTAGLYGHYGNAYGRYDGGYHYW